MIHAWERYGTPSPRLPEVDTVVFGQGLEPVLTYGITLTSGLQITHGDRTFRIPRKHFTEVMADFKQAVTRLEPISARSEPIPIPFKGIFGHAEAKDMLSRMSWFATLPTAILIQGPKHTGKSLLAREFIREELCTHLINQLPCRSCVQLDSSSHPDVLTPQGNGIDNIRSLDLALRSKAHGGSRYVTIFDADELTPAAHSALLKMLEEPPADTTFVLTASRELPDTILSRCWVAHTGFLTDEEVMQALTQQNIKATPDDMPLYGGTLRKKPSSFAVLSALWDKDVLDKLDRIDPKVLEEELSAFSYMALQMVVRGVDRIGKVTVAHITPEKATVIVTACNRAMAMLEKKTRPELVLQWTIEHTKEIF